MQIIVGLEDRPKLRPETWDDLMSLLASAPLPDNHAALAAYNWANVVALGDREVEALIAGVSDEYIAGLLVFAEKGPIITAADLEEAGITNTSHFQSAMTKRVRTVTGNKKAFLMTWDDWYNAPEGEGTYAIRQETHDALRRYFAMNPRWVE